MASEYAVKREETTEGPRCTAELMTRSIVLDATASDPLSGGTTVRAMTLSAPTSAGTYKPVRMTLATAPAEEGSDTTIAVAETTMFAVGDVVGVVAAATPTERSSVLGTVQAVNAEGGTLTLAEAAAADVAVGDIIIVRDTQELGRNAVLLRRDVATLNTVTKTRVQVGAVGIIAGQARRSDVVCSKAGGAVAARIAAELPLFDIVPE